MAQSKSQNQSQPDKRQSGESEIDLVRGTRASLCFVRDFVGQSLNGAIDALAGRQIEKEYLASVSSELARRYVRGREIMAGHGDLKNLQSLSPEDRLAVRAYLKVRDLPKSLPFYDKETLSKDLDRELSAKAGRSRILRREEPAVVHSKQAQLEHPGLQDHEEAVKDATRAAVVPHGEAHVHTEPKQKQSAIDGEKTRGEHRERMMQSEKANTKPPDRGELAPKGSGNSGVKGTTQPQIPSGSNAVEPWSEAGNTNSAKTENQEKQLANGSISRPSVPGSEPVRGPVRGPVREPFHEPFHEPSQESVHPHFVPVHDHSSSGSSSSSNSSSSSGSATGPKASSISSAARYGAETPFSAATSPSSANRGAASTGPSAKADFREGRKSDSQQEQQPRPQMQTSKNSEKYSTLPPEKSADKKQEISPDKSKPVLTKQQILSTFRQRMSAETITVAKRTESSEKGQRTSAKAEAEFHSGADVTVHAHDASEHPHLELTARASGRSIRAVESRIVRLLADDQLPLSFALDDPRPRGTIKTLVSSARRAAASPPPRSSDRRYFITGPEIAFATIIALAAAAKARPDQPDILAGRLEARYELHLPDNAGSATKSDRKEESNYNGEVIDKKEEISYSFFDTVASDRPKPANRVRPKVLVGKDDTLVSLAEQLFDDPQLAWLILDINNDSLTVIIMDGRSIVRLRCRQEIFIPVSQDIAEFSGRELPASSHLVTVVDDNQVDREILDSAFDPLLGNAADQSDVELLDEFGELIITNENEYP